MSRDAKAGLEFLETALPEKAFAEDQECPAVADDSHRARERTLLFLQRVPFHCRPPTAITKSFQRHGIQFRKGIEKAIDVSPANLWLDRVIVFDSSILER
jgi:hypothetical protein